MKKLINNISIYRQTTILQALRKMDESKKKLLLVLQNDKTFFSLLSIGDIQRAIINNTPLDYPIEKILRSNVIVADTTANKEKIKQQMKSGRTEFMPILDDSKQIIDIIFWEDLFEEKQNRDQFNLPVVIMAGGKGTRLKPLTNVIPKPLIPIGDKTIIEEIMDRFVEYGCHQFYLSVNYKAELIEYYFKSLNNKDYNIDYFKEDKPLGTAGSLSLLKNKIDTTFFVSNCDILINQDYSDILKYHNENENEITIIAALKHYSIPYGTIETSKGGVLTKLEEKPELTFQINSGMYILEPHLLNEIPVNEFFHITTLIENVQKRNGKVGVFPVSEGSWKDIGDWNEYLKNLKQV